jgi:hypothetical protein
MVPYLQGKGAAKKSKKNGEKNEYELNGKKK